MKNKILVYFFALSVLLPSTASAQSLLDQYAPGTSNNPIEIQIVQDPMEQLRLELNALESRLKTQYGYTRYNSCVSSSCVTADSTRDLTIRSSCLRYTESCLGRTGTNSPLPPSTRSETQLCQMDHGQNSRWSGGYTANGGIECVCNSGYQWEGGLSAPQRYKDTQCVPVPVLNRNQECANQWAGSIWTGQLSSQGGSVCGCATNYEWNDTRTHCVQVIPTLPPQIMSGGGGGSGSDVYTPPVPSVPSVISTFTYNAELAHDISKREMLTNGSATLRSCPARTCEQKGVYPSGTTFTVRQQYGSNDLWYRGTTPDGNEGWIFSSLLNEVAIDQAEDVVAGTNASASPLEVIATSSKQEPVAPKQSTWRKVIRWLTFWR